MEASAERERYEISIHHPELQSGEVWVLNLANDDFSWQIIGWQTKRKGRTAYGPDGQTLDGLMPVFVQRAELLAHGINIDKAHRFLKCPCAIRENF